MEVESSPLEIEISEVFNLPHEFQQKVMETTEGHEGEYAVIFVQEPLEDELNNSDCEDLFQESREQLCDFGLQSFIKEISSSDESEVTPVGDDPLIIDTLDPKDVASPVGDETKGVACVLISDDEGVPSKPKPPRSSKKRSLISAIPEVTEETILKEFYFEDEDISVIDEHRLGVSQKTLVRLTGDGYHCPLYCTFITKEQSLMISHLINHKKSVITNNDIKDSAYLCPLCPFTTFYHSIFVRHISCHKKITCNLICSKCPFKATSVNVLKRHESWKHATTYVFCQNCPFKAKRLWNLRRHEQKCRKPERLGSFKCHFEPCPFTAPTEENLKTHEWIQHQVGSSTICSYKCPVITCHFETFRKELFEQHVEMHSGEQLKCTLCNFRTEGFAGFKEHILGHISVP